MSVFYDSKGRFRKFNRGNFRVNLIRKAASEAGVSPEEAEDSFRGYQAHHIIPIEILKEVLQTDEENLSEEFNEVWNGIFLNEWEGDNSHFGSHSAYTNFVRIRLAEEFEREKDIMKAIKNLAAVIKSTLVENEESDLGGTINDFEQYIEYIEQILINES